ncbi:MAG: hypothetical protein ACRDD1_21530 [Planctomycetia bacterium]
MKSTMSVTQQKEVFKALVELQDHGKTVKESRAQIAADHALTVKQVEAIEAAGLEHGWPPLD